MCSIHRGCVIIHIIVKLSQAQCVHTSPFPKLLRWAQHDLIQQYLASTTTSKVSLSCSQPDLPKDPLYTGSVAIFQGRGKHHQLSRIVASSFWMTCVKSPLCECAKSLQSCLTLCNPVDWGLPGFSVHSISRQEYWSGLPFPSPGDLRDPVIKPVCLMSPKLAGQFFTTGATCLRITHSVMSDSATPWSAVHQASLSMGFPRQEYWSGLPFPSPGHLPNPGIKPASPTLQADSLPSAPPGKPVKTPGVKKMLIFSQPIVLICQPSPMRKSCSANVRLNFSDRPCL